jgi:hypothetical protein
MKIKILDKIPFEKRLGFGFIVGITLGLVIMAIASAFKYGF